MSYYPTIEEDLARAKALIETGRRADFVVAYKLLESFVAEIERLQAHAQMLQEQLDLCHEELGPIDARDLDREMGR